MSTINKYISLCQPVTKDIPIDKSCKVRVSDVAIFLANKLQLTELGGRHIEVVQPAGQSQGGTSGLRDVNSPHIHQLYVQIQRLCHAQKIRAADQSRQVHQQTAVQHH